MARAVVVCQLAYCHAGPGCPICDDVPCECARCSERREAEKRRLEPAPAPEAKAEPTSTETPAEPAS